MTVLIRHSDIEAATDEERYDTSNSMTTLSRHEAPQHPQRSQPDEYKQQHDGTQPSPLSDANFYLYASAPTATGFISRIVAPIFLSCQSHNHAAIK